MFNLIFGYNDYWHDYVLEAATGLQDTIFSDTVPADEVWVLQAASIRNQSKAAIDYGIVVVNSAGEEIPLKNCVSVAQWVACGWTGIATVPPLGKAGLGYYGCTAGNTMEGGFLGYKMKLTQ